MLLKKVNNYIKKLFLTIPIKIRLTFWYTFFILILFFSVIAAGFYLEEKYLFDNNKDELIENVEKFSYKPSKFKSYDDGIYFIRYDETGKIIGGRVPKDFDINLPFSIEDMNTYNNQEQKFLYYDVRIMNSMEWVRGIFPISNFERELTKFIYILFTLSPIIIFAVIYGGYKIIKNGLRPIKKITDTALDIKRNKNFSKRIEFIVGKDEVATLATTFNEMLDTVESSFEREKQFTSDASHELRTPLTVIAAEVDYALKYSDTFEETQESLKVIERQAQKMKALINQIMELSKLDIEKNIEKTSVNISSIIFQVCEDYKYILEEKNINLTTNIKENLRVFGNKIMLERVFLNLFTNAIKFTKDKIDISLYTKKDFIYLDVKDNGIGLSEESIKKVWDRFYQVNDSRNKEKNKGSGLGLAMVKRILDLHSATAEIESKIDFGTTFRIKFESENKLIK